jgi:DNA-binding MarR family transcriptional regulator
MKSIASPMHDLANRLFFRLYQCANMLHKTGTKAVEEEGLTTQQWAVMGALSRDEASAGLNVGDLAKYLMVSRQNLSGLLTRMMDAGHLQMATDESNRRAKLITLTPQGRKVWAQDALPKIYDYYDKVLTDFSSSDMTHTLHYLLKLLDNMKKVDNAK